LSRRANYVESGAECEISSVKKNLLYRLPVLLYCMFIYWQSSSPSLDSLPAFPFSDKLLHLGAYAFLGVLVYRVLRKESLRLSKHQLIVLAILLSSLYGISDEIHQFFVPSRNADLFDAIADIAGSIIGVAVFSNLSAR